MPIVSFPEFEQYRTQGFKGIFVGGCVSRGDGSSFRAKAHAHNEPYIKEGNAIVKNEQGNPKMQERFGWICVRSAKRLYTRPGQPSNLMWHELCHILTPGHSHDDVWRAKAKEYGVYIGKRYIKQRRTRMETKEMTVAKETMDIEAMKAVINDQDAKRMGPAKTGGVWFKSSKTGTLYRVNKEGEIYKVVETRESAPATNKKANRTTGGPSRQEMMEEARSKKIKYFRILSKIELIQALAKETTPEMLAKIQGEAIKRWKGDKTTKA